MTDPEPLVRDDPERSRYELLVEGALAAVLAYRRSGPVLELVHTEVLPEVEGRGLGAALVTAVLDDARRTGARVLPSCPFVRAYLARHPDRLDVVPPDQRERFGLPGDAAAPAG